jgi:hypothetical protein
MASCSRCGTEYGDELRKGGVYMLITASSEQRVLDAARALRQIP